MPRVFAVMSLIAASTQVVHAESDEQSGQAERIGVGDASMLNADMVLRPRHGRNGPAAAMRFRSERDSPRGRRQSLRLSSFGGIANLVRRPHGQAFGPLWGLEGRYVYDYNRFFSFEGSLAVVSIKPTRLSDGTLVHATMTRAQLGGIVYLNQNRFYNDFSNETKYISFVRFAIGPHVSYHKLSPADEAKEADEFGEPEWITGNAIGFGGGLEVWLDPDLILGCAIHFHSAPGQTEVLSAELGIYAGFVWQP